MSGPPKNSDFFYKNKFVPCKKCLTPIKHRVLLKVLTAPLRAHLSLTGRPRRMAIQRQIRNGQQTKAASRESRRIRLALTIRPRKVLKNLKEFSSCLVSVPNGPIWFGTALCKVRPTGVCKPPVDLAIHLLREQVIE